MSANPSLSSSRSSTLARPGAMVLGAALICWRDRSAHWPWVLLALGLGLLLVALFWQAGYRPIDRALKRLQKITVHVFSWAVLLVVFALIFVPGRWILRSRLRAFWRRGKLDTYWVDGPAPSESQDFQRQF
jgi:hypothetical protein